MASPHRPPFRRVDGLPFAGAKVLSRSELVPGPEGRSPAAFLGRLWALFGPAAPRDQGFEYLIQDGETGLLFSAYSGASGPSYGGSAPREALLPVARRLEQALAEAPPVDCAMEAAQDIEYGGGRVRIGVRAGAPFEEAVPDRGEKKGKAASRQAKGYEDCVAMAKASGGAYGIRAGWQLRLEKALPALPDELEIDGRTYENCVGFMLSEEGGAPVFLFDEGEGLEEIAVARIPWPASLPRAAELWLQSYEEWRRAKGKKRAPSGA